MWVAREETTKKTGGQRSEGNLFSSPRSIPQVRQGFGVGCEVGFHPPARTGSFCQKHLGPKEKSCGGWVERAWALFYAKKRHNGVSAAKRCSAKFASALFPKQLHLQLTEERQTQGNSSKRRVLSDLWKAQWLLESQRHKQRVNGQVVEEAPQSGSVLFPRLPAWAWWPQERQSLSVWQLVPTNEYMGAFEKSHGSSPSTQAQ